VQAPAPCCVACCLLASPASHPTFLCLLLDAPTVYRDQPVSSGSPPTRDKISCETKARTRRLLNREKRGLKSGRSYSEDFVNIIPSWRETGSRGSRHFVFISPFLFIVRGFCLIRALLQGHVFKLALLWIANGRFALFNSLLFTHELWLTGTVNFRSCVFCLHFKFESVRVSKIQWKFTEFQST